MEYGPRSRGTLPVAHLTKQLQGPPVIAYAVDLQVPLQFQRQFRLKNKPLLLQFSGTGLREPAVQSRFAHLKTAVLLQDLPQFLFMGFRSPLHRHGVDSQDQVATLGFKPLGLPQFPQGLPFLWLAAHGIIGIVCLRQGLCQAAWVGEPSQVQVVVKGHFSSFLA